jgi:hypothetical protein
MIRYAYYEGERPGLGERFLAVLRSRVIDIEFNPQHFGVYRYKVRAAPLRGFPEVVYYRERSGDIQIVAVQHARRNTRNWRERL